MGGNRSLGTDPTISSVALAEQAAAADKTAPSDLAEGTMVGEYRVDGLLGAGGMGKVYSATHPLIGKRAAVKVLHPALSVDPDAVNRFIQEARAVNQIGHPNIVDIFAFGTLPDGRCYFVMEQLLGESLANRIEHSRLPLEDVLSILDSVAIALDAAHRKGIIHRDLKPDNVFLANVEGARPEVKLLDFGIAKLTGSESGAKRTQTGNVMGTPAYISPEQARGQGVDHRTDLYAFGAMAYEMLTGELVFPATNAADMIAQHLFQAPPSVRTRRPDIEPELDAMITRLLSKEANDRPTIEDVREQLRACRARMHQRMALHEGGHTDPVIRLSGPLTGAMPGVTGTTGMALTMTAPAAGPERRSTRILIVAAAAVVALVVTVVLVLAKGKPAASTPPAATTPAAATSSTDPAATNAATPTGTATSGTGTSEAATSSATGSGATTAGTTSPTAATGSSVPTTNGSATTTNGPATTSTTSTTSKTPSTKTTRPTTKPTTRPTTKTKPATPVEDPDAPM